MSGRGKEGSLAGVGDCFTYCYECKDWNWFRKSLCEKCGTYKRVQ